MRDQGITRASGSRIVAVSLAALLLVETPFAAAQAAPGTEPACRPRSIVVVPVGSPTRNAAEFEHALGSALSRHGCFRVVDVVDFLEAGMGEGQARLDVARDAAEAGTQAFLSMRLAEARAHLTEAVAAYTDGFAYLPYEGPFVEVLMVLGACEAALSNPSAATRAFRLALALKPDVNVEDYSTFPEAIQVFDAARTEARARVLGALMVDSRPQGVEALLDGRRFLGVTPLDEPDVPSGPHLVVLRKSGYVRKTVLVTVPPGGTASVSADHGTLDEARRKPLFDTAMHKLDSSPHEAGEAAAIEDIKALFLADLALVVRVEESPRGMSARATLWDLATMQRVFEGAEPRKGQVSVLGEGAAESLANAALAVVEERAEVRESGAATYEARSQIWSRWWFWTAVGAVVLGGVTATVLLTRPKEKAPGLPRDGNGAVIIRF